MDPNSKAKVNDCGTCKPDDTMAEMVQRVVEGHHHRLWMVDDDNKPTGVISLTDLIATAIDRMDLLKK